MPDLGHLLVIDDDESNRDLLARRLARSGFAVTLAADGPEALERVRGRAFDLLLLDVMMPGIDGLEVLRILREQHPPSELPVIMATARGDSSDVVRALGLGANDYVTKPFDFPVVLARVMTQLELKRSVDRVRRLERHLEQRNRELEEANSRLSAVNQRMTRDLLAAAEIQGAFLPQSAPAVDGVEFAWRYQPCEELAGDGLNIVELPDPWVGLYVLDVSGHGVASSLLSVSLSRVLAPANDPNSILVRAEDGPGDGPPAVVAPEEVAEHLGRLFPFDPATGQFATLAYGVLDAESGSFRFTSAGHPGIVRVPATGRPTLLQTDGMPIGLVEGTCRGREVRLEPGERIYLYTDGIPEAMAPDGSPFGTERMLDALLARRAEALEASVEGLLDEVRRWAGGAEPRDDISLLAVEYKGRGGGVAAGRDASATPAGNPLP